MLIIKPTILFVHGSWHNPEHFSSIRKLFEHAGYATECPAHRSVGADPKNSKQWLADDTNIIRNAATSLVEDGKDVIVVMHSYGGVVGSEAIHESLGKKARAAQGQRGGVIHLVYLCAFVIPEGESLASALGGQLPPYISLYEDQTCWMDDPGFRVFNDVEQEDKSRYIKLLARVPTATQFDKTSYSAYKYFPSTYLFCTNDQALPLEVQKMMVETNGGGQIKTLECDAGHSPYISQPETILRLVQELSS